jgi:putative transposase
MHAHALSCETEIAMRGKPKPQLVLSDEEHGQLQAFARSGSLAAGLSNRAGIILSSADGQTNEDIAQRLKMTEAAVGCSGLGVCLHHGPPASDRQRVALVLQCRLHFFAHS